MFAENGKATKLAGKRLPFISKSKERQLPTQFYPFIEQINLKKSSAYLETVNGRLQIVLICLVQVRLVELFK